jgi:hypothetical protein
MKAGAKPAFLFASVFLSRNHSHNPDQKNGAGQGNDDGANQSACAAQADQCEEPAADYAANDSDYNVSQQAETRTFHDFAGKPTGNGSDEDEVEEVHVSFFPKAKEKGRINPAKRASVSYVSSAFRNFPV